MRSQFFPAHFVAELDKLNTSLPVPTETLIKHLSFWFMLLCWGVLRYARASEGDASEGEASVGEAGEGEASEGEASVGEVGGSRPMPALWPSYSRSC